MAVEAQAFNLGSLDSSNDGFGFNSQFQQQPQQFLMPQQQVQNDNFVFSAMKAQPSTFPQLGREIDGYMNLQNERLKLVLQEQRKQQLGAILGKLEARTAMVMRQKDEELAQATKRTTELQEFIKRLEMENQAWKRIAGENESMIANLNAAIDQLREKATIEQPSNGDLDDAGSCCDENRGEIETRTEEDEEAEETGERNSKRRKTTTATSMVCRSCNSRNSSVLFLPCRHLCCCTACEAFLYACPVCNSAKKGTIEALIS